MKSNNIWFAIVCVCLLIAGSIIGVLAGIKFATKSHGSIEVWRLVGIQNLSQLAHDGNMIEFDLAVERCIEDILLRLQHVDPAKSEEASVVAFEILYRIALRHKTNEPELADFFWSKAVGHAPDKIRKMTLQKYSKIRSGIDYGLTPGKRTVEK